MPQPQIFTRISYPVQRCASQQLLWETSSLGILLIGKSKEYIIVKHFLLSGFIAFVVVRREFIMKYHNSSILLLLSLEEDLLKLK